MYNVLNASVHTVRVIEVLRQPQTYFLACDTRWFTASRALLGVEEEEGQWVLLHTCTQPSSCMLRTTTVVSRGNAYLRESANPDFG